MVQGQGEASGPHLEEWVQERAGLHPQVHRQGVVDWWAQFMPKGAQEAPLRLGNVQEQVSVGKGP